MKLGEYNTLTVARTVDFGAYLADESGNEVLIPQKYIPEGSATIGRSMEVFVYNDSEGRPIATTLHPYATVGQLAFLRVADVNATGAFLEWGIEKHLLVPYREQKLKMVKGRVYLVYIYLDNASQRIAASARYEKYIDNVFPSYKPFEKVSVLIASRTDIGYKAVVDNLHSGMIYNSDIYAELYPGDSVDAYVRKIRPDGKIDLTLLPPAGERISEIAGRILSRLEKSEDSEAIGDFMTPEQISATFQCSKKDFKKAIGLLLKTKKVEKSGEKLRVLAENNR
ncbi:MAG: GntR family transcriptional regulator [Paramuribaculum sp.]|nr:GntR family transcriptional regulator [Paramuribaculum sp.]